MWSLAGNQAVDPPIQQLCSWDTQAVAPAALAWGASARSMGIQPLLGLGRSQVALCLERAAGRSSRPAWDACARAGGGFSRLGFRKLASGLVLGKGAASRPCAWEADPAALGLRLSGRRGRPGTASRSTGTRVRGFGPLGGAASLCSRCSRRFQVCAPLQGFMCGPPVH